MPAPADNDELIAAGREAWGRLKSSLAFEDWLALAHALEIGRRDVLRRTGCKSPWQKKYQSAMARWLEDNGLAEVPRQLRMLLRRLWEQRAEIQTWRATLSEAEQLKLNHPDVILTHFKAATRGFGDDAECKHKPSQRGVIWPNHDLARALRRGLRAEQIYGRGISVPVIRAVAAALLPHHEDLDELVAYQPPARAEPKSKMRPISPSLIAAETKPQPLNL
jgi:hypothetical protein